MDHKAKVAEMILGPAKPPEAEGDAGLLAAAQDLIAAVKGGDAQAVADAFKAMDTILDASEEGEGMALGGKVEKKEGD